MKHVQKMRILGALVLAVALMIAIAVVLIGAHDLTAIAVMERGRETAPTAVAIEPAVEESVPEAIPEPTPAQPPAEVLANAVDPGCAQAVWEFVRSLTKSPQGAYSFQEINNGGHQLVFERAGTRYTLVAPARPQLSFWERPVGTHSDDVVAAYYDVGAEGIVDMGGGSETTMYFVGQTGLESWPYWQAQYRTAVQATVAQFDIKCNSAP